MKTIALHAAFFAAGTVLVYVYAGYPLLAFSVAAWKRKRPPRRLATAAPPSVSIVLSTRDSAASLRARIDDCLAQEYAGAVEILVGCDGSLESYRAASASGDARVRAFFFSRIGKASVQNLLVREARSEIIVTTDVQTRFAPAFLSEITRPFSDPAVGGVTGVMRIGNRCASGTAHAEANYWSYEQWLRQQESDAGTLLAVVGACFAFRRAAYREIGAASDTDNLVPMQLAEQGYRTIQRPEAAVFEEAIETPRSELRNRTRNVTRCFADYFRHPRLLNPARFPGYCLGIVSHKLLRWLTPYFALCLLAGAVALRAELLPRAALWGGGVALACGLAGVAAGRYRPLPAAWAALASVLTVNLAFLLGTFQAARGKRIVTW